MTAGSSLESESSSGSGGVWKSGDLEIWEFGDLGTWPEMWGPKNEKKNNSQNPNLFCPKCWQGLD